MSVVLRAWPELMTYSRLLLTGAHDLWCCTCPPPITCSTSTALERPKRTTSMSMSCCLLGGVSGTHDGLARNVDRVLGELDQAGCAVGLTADHGMNDKVRLGATYTYRSLHMRLRRADICHAGAV